MKLREKANVPHVPKTQQGPQAAIASLRPLLDVVRCKFSDSYATLQKLDGHRS